MYIYDKPDTIPITYRTAFGLEGRKVKWKEGREERRQERMDGR